MQDIPRINSRLKQATYSKTHAKMEMRLGYWCFIPYKHFKRCRVGLPVVIVGIVEAKVVA